MTNAANEWAAKELPRLRRERGNRCDICKKKGNKRTLEFYHKRRTPLTRQPRGRKERIEDIKQHPASYGLAHKTCHRKKYAKQHSQLIKEGIREAKQ